MEQLNQFWSDLHKKETDIRLELRRNGANGRKVNSNVFIWLEQVEKIECQLNDLVRQQDKISFSFCNFYPQIKFRKKVVNLINEVKLLCKRASSLLVFCDRNESEMFSSQTLVGLSAQEASDQIWEFLRDPMVQMIGLHGKGGVGKTTVMKNIYSQLTNSEIFDKIIWVTLSKNISSKVVQDRIAMQLNIELHASEELLVGASRILEELQKIEKCLIILDDMWVPAWLNEIGIPDPTEENGLKILLTTRSRQVCVNMWVDKELFLSPLSETEAWDLFLSKSGDHVLNSEIHDIAAEIVRECRGIPLTIIAVGHALRSVTNPIAWRLALDNIWFTDREIQEGDDEEEKHLYNLLRMAYCYLKDKQVKMCFLYCAVFPEGYKFKSKELIRYWMAEDFIFEGSILDSVNKGNEILEELKGCNMLEISVEGGITWVKLHDLFRDLAVQILTKEFGFSVEAGLGIRYFKSEYILAHKISLIKNQIHSLDIFSIHDDLSTLLLRENPLSYVSSSFFYRMPNLRVLDMSYSGFTRLPQSLFELANLQVLFLQYCTNLEDIPSMENLKNLQILNLRGTFIQDLPQGIENLLSLKSLDLSGTVRLDYIQFGVISSLSNLEELRMQGSRVCKMESPFMAECFKEIRSLEQLEILTLDAVGFGDHLDTILHLQGYSLKKFSVNAYGSSEDYVEDAYEI